MIDRSAAIGSPVRKRRAPRDPRIRARYSQAACCPHSRPSVIASRINSCRTAWIQRQSGQVFSVSAVTRARITRGLRGQDTQSPEHRNPLCAPPWARLDLHAAHSQRESRTCGAGNARWRGGARLGSTRQKFCYSQRAGGSSMRERRSGKTWRDG